MLSALYQLFDPKFKPISLAEMDTVKLMNRTDSKYVFESSKLPVILDALCKEYKILEIEGSRISRYESLYYDTVQLELYHQHQTGKSNRYKIRSRNYVVSKINFLEVKLKNNKKRTIKNRIKIDCIVNNLSQEQVQSDFISLSAGYNANLLKPQFWVNYNRITFVSLERKERCTIDVGLAFVKSDIHQDFNFLIVLELKQEKASTSPISLLMKDMGIRSGGLSKYCLGVISFNPLIKHNNFKTKLMSINKLRTNEHI